MSAIEKLLNVCRDTYGGGDEKYDGNDKLIEGAAAELAALRAELDDWRTKFQVHCEEYNALIRSQLGANPFEFRAALDAAEDALLNVALWPKDCEKVTVALAQIAALRTPEERGEK